MKGNLFGVPIYRKRITVDWNRDAVLSRLDGYFADQLAGGEVIRTLHTEPVFAPIVNFMNESVAEYWQELDYDPHYPVELARLWANCMVAEHQFPYPIENHAPANISVVFYINKTEQMGDIYFENPLEHIWGTQPLSHSRRYEGNRVRVPTVTGDLLCFPSWLNHAVDDNKTSEKRLIVAGDYELRGLKHIKRFIQK